MSSASSAATPHFDSPETPVHMLMEDLALPDLKAIMSTMYTSSLPPALISRKMTPVIKFTLPEFPSFFNDYQQQFAEEQRQCRSLSNMSSATEVNDDVFITLPSTIPGLIPLCAISDNVAEKYKIYHTRSKCSDVQTKKYNESAGENVDDDDEEYMPVHHHHHKHKHKHKRKHRRKRAYGVSVNGFSDQMYAHNNDTHYTWMNSHEFVVKCHLCTHTFTNFDKYCVHIKVDHYDCTPHLSWLTCEFCGKTNAHKSNFISHLASHTGIKPFKCRLPVSAGMMCETEASTRQNLQTHMAKIHKLSIKHMLINQRRANREKMCKKKKKNRVLFCFE